MGKVSDEEQALWDEILPLDESLEQLLIAYPVPASTMRAAWELTKGVSHAARLQFLRKVLDKSSMLGQPVMATLLTMLDLEDESQRQSDRWNAAMADVEARKKSRKNFRRGVVQGR